MILWREPGDVPAGFGPSIVAIGKFDGVHVGHRAILRHMAVDAAATGAQAVAVTFDRNPLAVLAPHKCPPELVGPEHKAELLAETGIDAALMLHFDESLAAESAEDFVRRVLIDALRTREVLVGGDFRFGHGGAGDAELLRRMGREHGFGVEVVEDVASTADGRRVSSTWIRELLADGDVDKAAKLLGRAPSVWGEVVHGQKRGRELGYPTANLSADVDGFVPADGVYAGWLIVHDSASPLRSGPVYPAAVSVGTNPTFEDVSRRQVEAYVLDETGLDLYDRRVEVRFVSRVRGMTAFDGMTALIDQIRDDVERVRERLSAEV